VLPFSKFEVEALQDLVKGSTVAWEEEAIMIYFVLAAVAFRHLKKYHFVAVDSLGNRARWRTGSFFIMENYDGTYSYFRIMKDPKSGKFLPAKAVHEAILVINKDEMPGIVHCHQVYSPEFEDFDDDELVKKHI
jgi:hypothetical protein